MIAVIAYIPVLHQGYLDFFKQHPGSIYVLGSDYIDETPRMERDLRAIDPAVVGGAVKSLGLSDQVHVIDTAQDITAIPKTAEIIMPDEDISHQFATTHLKGYEITFVPFFLRWDRPITTTEFEVPADRTISHDQFDQEMIARSHAVAAKSPDWWRQVGAVLVRKGEVLLSAHNRPSPTEHHTMAAFGDPRSNFDAGEDIELTTAMHAEANLVAQAARQGIVLDKASIYVSTFPCPVCAKLLAVAGISKVYYDQGYSLVDAEDILKGAGAELILVSTKKSPPTRAGEWKHSATPGRELK